MDSSCLLRERLSEVGRGEGGGSSLEYSGRSTVRSFLESEAISVLSTVSRCPRGSGSVIVS